MSEQQILLKAIIEIFEEAHRPLHSAVVTERLKGRDDISTNNLDNNVSRTLAREASRVNSKFERVASNTYRLQGYDWSIYPEKWQSSTPKGVHDFRVRSIELINYRRFNQYYLELSNQFTLIVGDNGFGKTTLLDALATVTSAFFSYFEVDLMRLIDSQDVRKVTITYPNSIVIEDAIPIILSCHAIVGDKESFWTLKSDNGENTTRTRSAVDIQRQVQYMQQRVSEGKEVTLPAFAYYNIRRSWDAGPDLTNVLPIKPQSRFAGYRNWLFPFRNQKDLVEWFSTRTFSVLQEQRPDPELTAVQNAIQSCLPLHDGEAWHSIEYNIRQGELIAFNKDRTSQLPFRLLSDGYRNWIAMVADIARRTVMLNPHLGENAISETPGVVLIDEIDLHLHPKWQQRVVDDLKRTFPQIQFIATTHSPFIIQSLQEGELIRLDSDQPVDYIDKSIEDIAEDVMGVENPQRSRRYQKKVEAAKEYLARLEDSAHASETNGNKATQEELDALMIPFKDDPALQALLEIQRLVLSSKEQND